MSHDDAFAAFTARRRAAEAKATPRVTWRRVAPDTAGGWPEGGLSGIGPARRLVYARPRGAGWEYGRLDGGPRPVGVVPTKTAAQAAAAALLGAKS